MFLTKKKNEDFEKTLEQVPGGLIKIFDQLAMSLISNQLDYSKEIAQQLDNHNLIYVVTIFLILF